MKSRTWWKQTRVKPKKRNKQELEIQKQNLLIQSKWKAKNVSIKKAPQKLRSQNKSIQELMGQKTYWRVKKQSTNLLWKEGFLSHSEWLIQTEQIQLQKLNQTRKQRAAERLAKSKLKKEQNIKKAREEKEQKESFLSLYSDQIKDWKLRRVPEPKRGIRFTTHAFHRFHERIEQYWYSIDQIKADIKWGRKKIRLAWPGVYEVIWSLATYTLAKDRRTFDRIVLTMYMNWFQIDSLDPNKKTNAWIKKY